MKHRRAPIRSLLALAITSAIMLSIGLPSLQVQGLDYILQLGNGNNGSDSVGNPVLLERYAAQSFQVVTAGILTKIRINFNTVTGTPTGTATWSIFDDGGTKPGTTLLASGTFTPPNNTSILITGIAGPSLATSTTYWLQVRSTAAQSAGNAWNWRRSTGNTYAGGIEANTLDGGTSWNNTSGSDLVGQINTSDPTPTPTDTFTPSNTPTATYTPTDTFTPSNTPTITDTPSLTPSITDTPTDTLTPTITLTPTETFTPSDTPTPTPTLTIIERITHEGTLVPDGPDVATVYSMNAGELGIAIILLILLILEAMAIFLHLQIVRFLKRMSD